MVSDADACCVDADEEEEDAVTAGVEDMGGRCVWGVRW